MVSKLQIQIQMVFILFFLSSLLNSWILKDNNHVP